MLYLFVDCVYHGRRPQGGFKGALLKERKVKGGGRVGTYEHARHLILVSVTSVTLK